MPNVPHRTSYDLKRGFRIVFVRFHAFWIRKSQGVLNDIIGQHRAPLVLITDIRVTASDLLNENSDPNVFSFEFLNDTIGHHMCPNVDSALRGCISMISGAENHRISLMQS